MEALQSLSRSYEKYQDGGIFIEDTGSEDGLYVSEEEYWENYYNHPDFSYEWNNGYLEEKPMTDVKGSLIYQWFSDILRSYFSTHPIGTILNLEIGFRLAISGDISIRKPDMAIVLNDNPVRLHPSDCNFAGIFDLCVESLSYSALKEIKRDTVDKKREYQGVGVREYYILDARKTETAFYRLNRKGKYEKIRPVAKDVIQSEVLPGFRFRISDLYHQPSLKDLAEDEVYNKYVLPFYRDIREYAESESRRAEFERRRAEQAEEKADRLARKLKELGIDSE